MKGTVNPFEPWRPLEARIPPPLHAGRPWRPLSPPPTRAALEVLPLVEPVNPVPRNKPPERSKQPQGQGGQSCPSCTSFSQWIAFIVLCVLGCLCLDSVGWYRGTHVPRLVALGISAGLFAARAFSHRRSWYTRLRGMAVALAIAGVALWFVPTIQGVSLWSAYRQVEKLRGLPAGNVAEFQRGAASRQTLVEEFPSFAADVRAAEQAWLRRTVDEAIENADRQSRNDPHAALDSLRRLDQDLSGLKDSASVRKELESARRRTLEACAQEVRREAGGLPGKNP